MSGLIILLAMPFLSTPYTTSDIVLQEDVYNRTHESEHKISWKQGYSRKLGKLSVVKIIDYERKEAWIIDEVNGRIVREDVYLKEIKEAEEAKRQADIKKRTEEEAIADSLTAGGIHVTPDGRIIVGRDNPVESEDNRSYVVQFSVADDNVSDGVIDEIVKVFNKGDNLSVVGFASPDGVEPIMRMELAYRRLTNVSKILERNGYKVTYKLGVVCSSDIERSKCWRVDISAHRGNK